MKFVHYAFLLAAIALTFTGVVLWLGKGQVADAALSLALAAMAYGVWLQATKAERKS
jgi:hypothetical protein